MLKRIEKIEEHNQQSLDTILKLEKKIAELIKRRGNSENASRVHGQEKLTKNALILLGSSCI